MNFIITRTNGKDVAEEPAVSFSRALRVVIDTMEKEETVTVRPDRGVVVHGDDLILENDKGGVTKKKI